MSSCPWQFPYVFSSCVVWFLLPFLFSLRPETLVARPWGRTEDKVKVVQGCSGLFVLRELSFYLYVRRIRTFTTGWSGEWRVESVFPVPHSRTWNVGLRIIWSDIMVICGLPHKECGILRASLFSRKTPLKSNEVRRKRARALQET